MNRVFNNNLANERDVATHLDQGKSVRKSMHCIIDICVECKLVFSIHFGKCFISLIRLNGFFHNQNNGTIRFFQWTHKSFEIIAIIKKDNYKYLKYAWNV